MSADDITAALHELAAAAEPLAISLLDALRQKTEELRVREHIRRIPNSFITARQYDSYLRLILGRAPTSAELQSIEIQSRRPTIKRNDVEFDLLLAQQCHRCALCGAPLTRGRTAEIDHIIPISLGGRDDPRNYQLLCMSCNRDKGQLLGWVMGAPFFYRFPRKGSGTVRMSRKVRYCALVRDASACQELGCAATSRTAYLIVDLIVPRNAGGRPIFDNVITRCEQHHAMIRDALFARAVEEVRRGYPSITRSAPKTMPSFEFLDEMRIKR